MIFKTRTEWPYKTGGLLKEVQFIWNFLRRTRKRWLLNRGDCMVRFDCNSFRGTIIQCNNHTWLSEISNLRHHKMMPIDVLMIDMWPWSYGS